MHAYTKGITVVRTYLRLKHGREPTQAEMDEIRGSFNAYKKKLKKVTKEQISQAYEADQEVYGLLSFTSDIALMFLHIAPRGLDYEVYRL